MFIPTINTRFFGLLGNPLGQSAAAFMQNTVYQKLGLDYMYVPIELQPDQLEPVVKNLRNFNYAGSGVTMPFKTIVHKYLDGLADSAKYTEVVNTIVIGKDGKMVGHNTDGIGMTLALRKKLGLNISEHNYLILGAGGAATAIACALAMAGAKDVRALCIKRDFALAESLAAKVNKPFPGVANVAEMNDDSIRDSIKQYDVIIHATKVGMFPHCGDVLFNPDFLSSKNIVCDVVYVPVKTKLLMEAEKRGCTILSGLWMNTYQAAEQMRLWIGLEDAPIDMMYEQSLEFLRKQGRAEA